MPTAVDVGAITDAQAQAKVDARLSATEKSNLASNKTLGGSLLYHVGNKPNATDVGARPSTWMPTAVDVGAITDAQAQAKVDARLSATEKSNLANNKTLGGSLLYHDGNKPNATDVGARPSTWMPSAADVGAITDAQAQSKVDARLSETEKANMASNKTLDGKILYHEDRKPTPAEIGAETPSGAQSKVNSRLSSTEKTNLSNNKTLSGSLLYHAGNKPSAIDVGARPDNWIPSAEDVGARDDKWLPTPSEIGAETPQGAQDKVNVVASSLTALTTRVANLEEEVSQLPNMG
jgi:hypothetical protein